MKNKDKFHYINIISEASDRYGNLLIEMMEKYNKYSLKDLTYEEVYNYYNNDFLKKN